MMKEIEDKRRSKPHSIHMDRRKATISGVEELESFNEVEVILTTSAGGLTVEGENLHIEKLNLDDGQVILRGYIFAVVYAEEQPQSKGLFGKFWSK